MTGTLGAGAIVIGAGIGGLAAAAALAPHFGRVTILDRDTLVEGPRPRTAIGQGAHTHQLLKGGERALERLMPGVTAALQAAGAVPLRVGQDISVLDFGGQVPAFDAGYDVLAMSRPAYEAVLRDAVRALPNVAFRDQTPVARCLVDNGRCAGVELSDGEKLAADLVVDATGLTAPMIHQLVADGVADFDVETVRINVAYVTARFAQPPRFRGERKAFFVLPAPPNPYFGLLLPIEGDQWTVSLGGRGSHLPPKDLAGFRDYASRYPAPEIFERIGAAELTAEPRIFHKATVDRRRIDRARAWPERLIPIGDTISSANPTYGQGMSVAALQAADLRERLDARAASGAGLDGLTRDFMPVAFEISDRAWSLALNSDYVYPETEGERPSNFPVARNIAAVLRKLCDTDPEFLAFRTDLGQMVASGDALRSGPLAIRFLTALQGSMSPPS